MTAETKKEKLHTFYRSLCISFVGTIRALSLYPPEHPETEKKVGIFFKRVSTYLNQRPTITLIFFNGEVVVENIPLPELSKSLAQLLQRLETMRLQRFVFRRGLSSRELVIFLQLLVPLLKNPSGADVVLAKNQEHLPHILAGTLPFEAGPRDSHEELSGVLQASRKSVLSFSDRLKDLFADLKGPLPEDKVSASKDLTETMYQMVATAELPIKILLYRRSTDPDPYVHAVNVSALSMALAQELHLDDAVIRDIGLGGLLHDVGLHASPATPLSKSQAITIDEKKRQWAHPVRGAEILLASPGMPDLVALVAYEHHLHFDGGGYPEHERPRQLNLASMITCIANSYDNLRRNRAEQNALSLADALNWMDRQAGKHFHPLLLIKFRALAKEQVKEKM